MWKFLNSEKPRICPDLWLIALGTAIRKGAENTGEGGLEDGVIPDFRMCDLNPASLLCEASADEATCLLDHEVAAAQNIYIGVVLGSDETAFFLRIGLSYVQNAVMSDPDWDPSELDMDSHIAMAEAHDQGHTIVMDPDLSDFAENGGLLLMYHGMADGIISHDNTQNYCESVGRVPD